MEFNYYEILGVNRNASNEDIKASYKNLAKKYHPDKHEGNLAYEEHFKKINAAYQTLSNEQKRQRYDLKLIYKAQKASAPQQKRSSPRPASGPMKKQTKPVYDKKQTTKYLAFTLAGLLVFISAAVFFYNYMNAVTAKDRLQEGKQLEAQKKFAQALDMYSEAIGYDESLTEALVRRGDLRIKMIDDFNGAIGDYSRALRKQADSSLYYKRAKCFFMTKQYEEGMKDLNKALETNPKFDSLYFYRAEVNNYKFSKPEEAIRDYEKTLQLNNQFEHALFGLAVSKQNLKDYEGSIKDFNNLIQLKPEDGSYYYYRAFSKIELKDSSGACNDWFQAEKLSFEEAKKMMDLYCQR